MKHVINSFFEQITLKPEVINNVFHLKRLQIHQTHHTNYLLNPAKTNHIHTIGSWSTQNTPQNRCYSGGETLRQNEWIQKFAGLFKTTKAVSMLYLMVELVFQQIIIFLHISLNCLTARW